MAFNLVGTEYGGWMIDMDLIPEGSTIVSAGVGEDISFDRVLIKEKKCKVIGIDPTLKSHVFIDNQRDLENYTLIKKALDSAHDDVIRLYKNRIPRHVSESVLTSHHSVSAFESYYTDTINLSSIFKTYSDISVIKMDIEGSEYKVIDALSLRIVSPPLSPI